MALIDLATVKSKFPRWNQFCLDDNGDADETILQSEIDDAIAEFGGYISRTDETITDAEKLHLLNIIRKRCFDRLHGDTSFENKPRILKDYDQSIQMLQQSAGLMSFESQDKVFTDGNWFNEPYEDLTGES